MKWGIYSQSQFSNMESWSQVLRLRNGEKRRKSIRLMKAIQITIIYFFLEKEEGVISTYWCADGGETLEEEEVSAGVSIIRY